jgi:hypothetical protein
VASGESKQKQVSQILFAGIACVAVSVGLFIMSALLFIGIGKMLAFILLPIGIVLVVVGLAAGWSEAMGDPSKKPVQRANQVYVIAKVIADKKANPVIDPGFHDPEDLRYLVQFQVPGKGKMELETAAPVFDGVGEGMYGDIVYQGRWLNQFTFRPKPGAQDVGEDPFRAGKL